MESSMRPKKTSSSWWRSPSYDSILIRYAHAGVAYNIIISSIRGDSNDRPIAHLLIITYDQKVVMRTMRYYAKGAKRTREHTHELYSSSLSSSQITLSPPRYKRLIRTCQVQQCTRHASGRVFGILYCARTSILQKENPLRGFTYY